MKRLLLAIGCGFMLLAAGCGGGLNHNVVAVDLLHGQPWPTLERELGQLGLQVLPLRNETDFRRLARAGTLLILASDSGTAPVISEDSTKKIERFVRAGGGLLCAAESWSWVAGGERVVDHFPLNTLGRRLGFRILDRAAGAPRNISPSLLGGLDGIRRSDWWASEVRVDDGDSEPLITDEDLRPMAVRMPYGRGRVVVVGHCELLRENPEVLRNVLLYLTRLDELVL